MKNEAEMKVSTFYNTVGWELKEETTEDARRFEDLRDCATEYVSKCRLRVLRHIPDVGENLLDMASGPIQYKEYLEYSKNFKRRYCVDLSAKALEDAKVKIGDHGVFLCGSFFDIELQDDFFDCSVSLHTIYHIDKDRQEEAVRKLVRVTKPGKPVIIVYSNPGSLLGYLHVPAQFLKKILRALLKPVKDVGRSELYFHSHPIKWWSRFSDVADVQILPWRSLSSFHQKALIPNNDLGKQLLDRLFNLEDLYPGWFANHFQYPMIVLKKK